MQSYPSRSTGHLALHWVPAKAHPWKNAFPRIETMRNDFPRDAVSPTARAVAKSRTSLRRAPATTLQY
ncbi:hypothetical protein, partial [Pseudomonas aeruginosa]|uniref:hypothetical protein n=1 Tax=Pseudomonas aeruginosa TaxID=287 RepID=UPI001ABC8345